VKIKLSYAWVGYSCDVSGMGTSVVEQLLYHKNPNTQSINQKLIGEEWAPALFNATNPSCQVHTDVHYCMGQSNVNLS